MNVLLSILKLHLYEYCIEAKLQAKFDKYDQNFDQPEE